MIGTMTTPVVQRRSVFTVVTLACAGFLLAGCGATPPPPTPDVAQPTTAAAEAPATAAPSTEAGAPSTIHFSVTGQADRALIRDVAVTEDTADNTATTERALPWNTDVTFTAAQMAGFHKFVLFVKNVDGNSGALSCAITVDGVQAAVQSTKGSKPATCVVVQR